SQSSASRATTRSVINCCQVRDTRLPASCARCWTTARRKRRTSPRRRASPSVRGCRRTDESGRRGEARLKTCRGLLREDVAFLANDDPVRALLLIQVEPLAVVAPHTL